MSDVRMRWSRLGAAMLALTLAGGPPVVAQAPMPAAGGDAPLARLDADHIRTWLTYLSSDLLQGRGVFTEGYGLASAYIAQELGRMGVTPLGDEGTYFQSLGRTRYRADVQGHVTISIGQSARTFEHGDHVVIPDDAGVAGTRQFSRVVFAGTGTVPTVDRALIDLSDALVLIMPDLSSPPAGRGGRARESFVRTLSAALVGEFGAGGVIALVPGAEPGGGGDAVASTIQPLDRRAPPLLTADETFFAAALNGAPVPLADLRARLDRREPLPSFVLDAASAEVAIANTYDIEEVALTQNVVGLIEGADPVLRETYVFFGAHLDHVGYSRDGGPQGRVNTPVEEDRIWNGADDDGSGSAALLEIARAFTQGPRPRRSIVVVWHAGEEEGLLGSQYMANHPVVPLDRIQVQLNVDMIGRNRDDDPSESDTLYVIGADRISTDLHNVIVDANAAQPAPLTIDYEFNDPEDPNRFYVRSDHYSYASKGIPIAFFFTGTHPDYHANTDTVDKILFPKLTRIAQLIYETGFRIADRAEPLDRDNRGARSGRGFSGRLD